MTDQNLNSTARKAVTTMKAAAKIIGVDRGTLENWRDEGCPGLPPVKFSKAAVLRWAAKHGKRAADASGDLKSRKTAEEIRKLKLANDAREGRLVERAWVAERMQRAFGDLNKYRAKSEAEHAVIFAGAGDDIAACREIVRKMWDEIMTEMNALKVHFKEPGK